MRITQTPTGWVVAIGRDRHALLDTYISGNVEPETPAVPWSPLTASSLPVDRLSWRTRFIELTGRDAEREQLLDWARSDRAVAVRYLEGAPGVGKTRLSAEVADELQREGWSAGFVDWRDLGVWRVSAPGTLLVLDDVAPILESQWLDLAEGARDSDPAAPRVRLLIVTREPTMARRDWRALFWHAPDVQRLYGLDRAAAEQLHARAVERLTVDGLRQEVPLLGSGIDYGVWSENRSREGRYPVHAIATAFRPLGDETYNAVMYRLVDRWCGAFKTGDPLDVCDQLRRHVLQAPTDSVYIERFIRGIFAEAMRRGHAGEVADTLAAATPAALVRLDRMLVAYENVHRDCEALAPLLVARGWHEPAFLDQLARFDPQPRYLVSRLLTMEAPHIYEQHPWLTPGSRKVFAAWQYRRESQREKAAEAAAAAVAGQMRHLSDDTASPDLRRAQERFTLDIAWFAADVVGASHQQAHFYRTCASLAQSDTFAREERVLALKRLAECETADDGERVDALREVVTYHRHGGPSLLLAIALEWFAAVAPQPEARDALREAIAIRQALPTTEREFLARAPADRLRRREWGSSDLSLAIAWMESHPEHDLPSSGDRPLTAALTLAMHLENVRHFEQSPEARRALVGLLQRFTHDPSASWSSTELEHAHRSLWRGLCELPLFGS
jgi:hypothetical protein